MTLNLITKESHRNIVDQYTCNVHSHNKTAMAWQVTCTFPGSSFLHCSDGHNPLLCFIVIKITVDYWRLFSILPKWALCCGKCCGHDEDILFCNWRVWINSTHLFSDRDLHCVKRGVSRTCTAVYSQILNR